MSWGDSLHYIAVGNPISRAVIGSTKYVFGRGNRSPIPCAQASGCSALVPAMSLHRYCGRSYIFVRLAGLSGAAAVILAGFGSHKLNGNQDKGDAKAIFETANRFHFFHSLALLAMPMTKYPLLSGGLMLGGSVCFTGLLYYRAFTGDKQYSKYAPFAGVCLIAAWLTMVL